MLDFIGAPYGNRTRVSAVKGRCPGPLDEGRDFQPGRRIDAFEGMGKQSSDGCRMHFELSKVGTRIVRFCSVATRPQDAEIRDVLNRWEGEQSMREAG